MVDNSGYDLLPEAVVLVAADGTVEYVNDRAAVLLGVASTAVGGRLEDHLDLRDDGDVRCHLPGTRPRVGDRLPERILRVAGNGTHRPVAVAGRWTVAGGLVLTARSAGRREALEAVQGDVVATVAHEIRTPLTSVKGFTRTLLARWDRISDEQKRGVLETIEADADRVTRLLRELLEVSRIDAGRVTLRRAPVDLAVLAEMVAERARHRDAAEGRELKVVGEPDLPAVLADADKLEQALTNLVENALHHAPESPVRVMVTADGDGVLVTISDEGPGIPAEQRREVFQKFGRGRDARTAGTGLGLYITRGLVEAHGGRVWIDPEPVSGATFHVWLPAQHA